MSAAPSPVFRLLDPSHVVHGIDNADVVIASGAASVTITGDVNRLSQ